MTFKKNLNKRGFTKKEKGFIALFLFLIFVGVASLITAYDPNLVPNPGHGADEIIGNYDFNHDGSINPNTEYGSLSSILMDISNTFHSFDERLANGPTYVCLPKVSEFNVHHCFPNEGLMDNGAKCCGIPSPGFVEVMDFYMGYDNDDTGSPDCWIQDSVDFPSPGDFGCGQTLFGGNGDPNSCANYFIDSVYDPLYSGDGNWFLDTWETVHVFEPHQPSTGPNACDPDGGDGYNIMKVRAVRYTNPCFRFTPGPPIC